MGSTSRWNGDLLERHIFGDFLYKFIVQRYESQKDHDATCCALDGAWGEGKSFFINHWAKDIEGNQHPVIIFDAWKNDHHNDPLLSFIAHINNELQPFISKTPKGPRIAATLKNKAKKTLLQAGKAAIPLSTAAAKNYAKKIIGEEGGEVAKDIFKNNGEIISEKDIDKFLENSFKDYSKKNLSIEKVKSSLEQLAENLKTIGGFRAPIFIIIDELDRCRPDYAISLLEGIKHILNSKGIAFVISTNISQLAESVKVLYGHGFDGRNYLRRFFDFDYQLPKRSALEYIQEITKNTSTTNIKFVESGLYIRNGFENTAIPPEKTIDYITSYFNLDLRSKKQVIVKAECFIALQENQERVNLAYLIALCCLDIKNGEAIERLIRDPNQRISTLITDANSNTIFTVAHTNHIGNFSRQEKSLSDILDIYQLSSAKTLKQLYEIDSPNCFEKSILSLKTAFSEINPISKYPQQIKRMTKTINPIID